MDTKGGRFTLDVSGKIYSGRGAAKIMPALASPTTGVNMDGSGYKTIAPKLASLDLTFDRGVGLKWDADMILQDVNATFIETDLNVMHLFTAANWEGDPVVDTSSGEVTGMKITTATYKQSKAA